MKIILSIVVLVILAFAIRAIISKNKGPKIGEIAPASELKEKYNLTAENRPDINIDPENVPENLRDLIPIAEKWGIGDDVIRDDFEKKTTDFEKEEFTSRLKGRTVEVTAWLDSFKDGFEMSEEAGHFMYMLEALDEMGLWPD
jgi:hypothetical protein